MVVYLYARRFAYLKIKYVNLVLLPKLLRYKSNINDNLLDGNNEFDGDHASYYNFRNLWNVSVSSFIKKRIQRSVIVIDIYVAGFRKLIIMKEDWDTKTE